MRQYHQYDDILFKPNLNLSGGFSVSGGFTDIPLTQSLNSVGGNYRGSFAHFPVPQSQSLNSVGGNYRGRFPHFPTPQSLKIHYLLFDWNFISPPESGSGPAIFGGPIPGPGGNYQANDPFWDQFDPKPRENESWDAWQRRMKGDDYQKYEHPWTQH